MIKGNSIEFTSERGPAIYMNTPHLRIEFKFLVFICFFLLPDKEVGGGQLSE